MNADTNDSQAPSLVAGLLLAGGAGTRMDGKDKGMMHWRGKPMAVWVAEALKAATGSLLISANRSLEEYSRLGDVFTDAPEFAGQGPLAGLLAGLRKAEARGNGAVLVCPCDTPGVTPALMQLLLQAWYSAPGQPVIARCDGRDHPLHGVYPVAMAAALEQQLRNDNRRVMMFARSQQAQSVDCPAASELFTNRNRPQDLKD
ncbi:MULTISPECIES: molybdenum cofactor guanylyltransferase MobA [unclassified Marinobacter]|uniref:molybdenum cofactor guanylyltransferase MobA n=1 Tax=unclassified Marinobacter TaxID=83889 RepID=UPI000BFA093C|nr:MULTISPECIES: molybdenum cofactor guanylyltransferase MobA [unclassified Marinobacter]PFG10093.1 molybdenum cofactor guanylyltransferase [Marinobacter sp. LV10MA510-1]PFG52037.1 molybdenum cofactor guanylyltransferase [Marinobacter sp. LV10R520-4]